MIRILPILAVVCGLALAQEQFENSTMICNRCKCTSDSDNTILDCTNRNIRHSLANWPEHKNKLKATFSSNNITTLESIPPTNAQLELVLSDCRILEIHPQTFGNVINIIFLDLSRNLLTADKLKGIFQGPYNNGNVANLALKHLDLSHNQIHSLPSKVFSHTPNLEQLNLEGNDFRVLDLQTQLALQSVHLRVFNLADNELTELVGGILTNDTGIIELDLSKNHLDFVPMTLAHIGNTLQVLKLDDNPIIEMIDETFLGLERLRELSVNNLTELKFVNANTFAPLKQLEKLQMSNNSKLLDIDREAFAPNENLKEVYLSDNQLFDIDFRLLNWSKLEAFHFHGNPLECSCDLHNISRALSAQIRADLESIPYCLDPRTGLSVKVHRLDGDICDYKTSRMRREQVEKNFNVLRTTMVALSIILTFSALLAMGLGYARYRKIQRNSRYPFASQILYNPLSTNMKF